jgi:rhamnulokinase
LRAPETPAEVTRCLLDSLALAYRVSIEQSQRLSGRDVEVIHMIGGGAKNSLLCGLTAEACQRPVLAGPAEATSLGNVLSQAISAGAIEGVDHARALVRRSFSPVAHTPSADPATAQRWKDAASTLLELRHERRGVSQ